MGHDGAPLRRAPSLDVVGVGDDLLLRTDTAALRLDGGVAAVVRDRLLPCLAGKSDRRSLAELLADVPELERVLDRLIDAGVVVEGDPGWLTLTASDLGRREAIAARAAAARVVVIGAGAPLVEVLRQADIGAVVLVDPAELTRERAAELVAGADFVVTVVDRAMSAVRHWVNEASLAHTVPSLHADLRGHRAELGPLVLPGEGPCHLCWRMRALACEEDFEQAMAGEEALDAARTPVERPLFPTLMPWIASILGHEILAVTLGVAQPRLAGRVLALDAIGLTEGLHPVLPRPDCPACAKKDRPPRTHASLTELLAGPRRDTDFAAVEASAVSPLCGLVRALDQVPKDLAEPAVPVVVRAELANARFLPGAQGFVGCSGKGRDVAVARGLALGEALERYASLTWIPDRRVSVARHALDGPSLDPRDLVLYAEQQYAELPYAPYRDDTVLDWVPALSLAHQEETWVPLLAAHLGHAVADHDAYLFPATSNGFAAGPTTADALHSALLEVVERDAFLIAWAHRLPGRRHDARDIPDEQTAEIAAGYARRGVVIDVHLLPTDSTASVALAVGWDSAPPAVVVGLGASTDPVVAARRAVLEVAQVRPALKARLRAPDTPVRLSRLVAAPAEVAELEDHDLLYADQATAHRELGFLRAVPRQPWPDHKVDDVGLDGLVGSLIEVAGDVLYVDVTPDDVAALGVSVVRGIVPGFQPIHFGAREARLGGTRLREVPWRLGLRSAPATLADLNPAPHPVA